MACLTRLCWCSPDFHRSTLCVFVCMARWSVVLGLCCGHGVLRTVVLIACVVFAVGISFLVKRYNIHTVPSFLGFYGGRLVYAGALVSRSPIARIH